MRASFMWGPVTASLSTWAIAVRVTPSITIWQHQPSWPEPAEQTHPCFMDIDSSGQPSPCEGAGARGLLPSSRLAVGVMAPLHLQD